MLILISILGNLVAGGKIDLFFLGCWVLLNSKFSGKVAENANVSNAVNPAWRTAKTHVRIFLYFVFQRIYNKVLIRKSF